MGIYTYRNGERVLLEKLPDQFVVRALPDDLEHIPAAEKEVVSSASTRIRTSATDLEAVMSMSRYLAPTHHAYVMTDNQQEFLITDRVLVVFKEPPGEEPLDVFMGKYALILLQTYGERTFLFQLTTHTGMNPCKLVVQLMEHEAAIEKAEHDLNYRVERCAFASPMDPEYQRQWHLHRLFTHPEFDERASARCEEAWQLLDGFGSQEVVIGVTDDGCQLDHPDFDGGKFADWGYFQGTRLITKGTIGADPARMYNKGSDHGTSSAAVAAGNVNATHTVGAAPGCQLLPIKWENTGPYLAISDSKLLTAIEYLSEKVDIVSNSWGITPTSNWWQEVVDRIRSLSERGGKRGRGVLFLWAAGNSNCPINEDTGIDTPFTTGWRYNIDGSRSWEGVRTTRKFTNNLVGLPNVMHIAALASTAKRAHYSNYGKGVSLTAPSNNLHLYSRVSVKGLGVTTATGTGIGVTGGFGGTSSATPLVAGIASLLLSAYPGMGVKDLISVLQRTADKDLNFDGYRRTPPASYDPNPSWDVSPVIPYQSGAFQDRGSADGSWSPWFGFGKVNAAKAVAAALQMAGEVPSQAEGFSAQVTVGADIPDNDREGIRHSLECEKTGTVRSVEVSVKIHHTYVGDLRISLQAPDGTEVLLQDREGGAQDNLQRIFNIAEVPALAQLKGRDAEGEWTLQVQDLAEVDTGRLEGWGLSLQFEDPTPLYEADLSLKIPDHSPEGIRTEMEVGEQGPITDLEVSVKITHTYIQDLEVLLETPGGKQVHLHNRTGGSADNIIRTFTLHNTPALRSLQGEERAGKWALIIRDHAQADTGKLTYWSLQLS